MRTMITILTILALAAGCAESAEDRHVEAVGELAEGAEEARAELEGEDEITEEVRGEIAEARAEAAMEELLDVDTAVAVMTPTRGNDARGQVRFTARDEAVTVRFRLSNLAPGAVHGIHIHETGDCTAQDGSSAGGHYAPDDNPHGLPPAEERHAGDLGNVRADENGSISVARTFETFSLDEEHPVVGRAVILHAGPDSGGPPSGEAGARIACGVIRAVPGA